MISAIPFAAVAKISSAKAKAFSNVKSGYILLIRSVLITKMESTHLRISSTPFKAWLIRRFPSNLNGIVTIPIVRIPISFAVLAISGAAPVPVPPPIPAVTNTILVESCNKSLILSKE